MRYIGSKKLLLQHIKNMLDKHTNGTEKTFLDLFAGTNSVGLFFKPHYTIYSNDLLYFSYVNAKALIEANIRPNFEQLKKLGIHNPLSYLMDTPVNHLPSEYYELSYSPTGDAMYLTVENAKRVDFIHNTLDCWKKNNNINQHEYLYLLNSLIEALPFISNITGTYGAYLKHWDKRALNELNLIFPSVIDNGCRNKAFNENANTLIRKISVDIAYIDTPYNNRQYASNYHLLENIARHTKPPLKGKTKIFNWSELKSDFSTSKAARNVMEDLIAHIDATHVLLSYNTEGIISENELIELLKKYSLNGYVDIQRIPYRKYQSKQRSVKTELCELLFYIQKKPFKSKTIINNKETRLKPTDAPQKKWVKSPLNYIGGKYRLLKQILPFFPSNIRTFVDLFSGGANVGINVTAEKHIFNDMNYRINEMFRFFQKTPIESIVQLIESRIAQYGLSKTNEEGFLKFREDYNRNPNPLDLYVLSSFSYNYQFRFNNNMKFNNPFGRDRSSFNEKMKDNLKCFTQRLKALNAIFTDYFIQDFDISKLNKQDFVYLDPPYLITTGSYNDGNRGFQNWGKKQELEMYQLILQLNEKNIRFALSNVLEHKGQSHDMLKNFISENNFQVHYLNFHYSNASYNTSKQGSVEVLITNYSI
ncbi:Dam family site-specific DNA-(adenine-N6)-methyltransferase [Proteus mirabilis]|uniref:Dam family site-specific DNA-(adenine-N6)-methyltransferase n=1 Tax=Proteus mirabilis TaxID=584 RepID=UPI001A1DD3BD|nr:Dam family site-specific DNA-(adenine-N6)-methyltransferase [Proteus mirabilis]MBI6272650.1 Dam family site-specific DNA-(adenine-N6)-methyltransferase [Proteus mirabilis]MBI6295698.1 Dam family site-specific DNA-(adenine-N6)-methyltransferase [Proteus mirabilis]MDC9783356.1 Dam family site-specific DNA-(adenine-N6)-methyltransferase [Proteus mirabilis]HEK0326948.1 Dam family site-specific DNA-(adenine-N6)-methyltransferase [Proteus mirabilis]HEK2019976.1 Dam family site-specific DNA-(adeni